jgi:hypothetical protein
MKKHTPVIVTWLDAWHGSEVYGVEDLEKKHAAHVIHSTGLLVKHDETGVMIAGDVDTWQGEVEYDRVLFVPAGMVVKVTRLR